MNNVWNEFCKQKKNKENEKEEKIETRPYRCVICKNDKARFSNPGGYARHMDSAHQFHKGYDRIFPERSARKGFSLPKITEKQLKKKKSFKNSEETLNFVIAKSISRDRKRIKDYAHFIASYEIAKTKTGLCISGV